MTDFLKYEQNRKIWKVLSSGKVHWLNLLEQFPLISTINFAILFLSENLKEKTTIVRNCNFFDQSYFLHSGNQVFAYHAYTIYLYIKKALCLHNLCMNRTSLDRVSWTSTTLQQYGLTDPYTVPVSGRINNDWPRINLGNIWWHFNIHVKNMFIRANILIMNKISRGFISMEN